MSIRASDRVNAQNKVLISVSKRSKSCTCYEEFSNHEKDQIINFQKWHRESGLGSFDIKQAKAMRVLVSDIFKVDNLSCFDHKGYLHLFEHVRERVVEGASVECPRCS